MDACCIKSLQILSSTEIKKRHLLCPSYKSENEIRLLVISDSFVTTYLIYDDVLLLFLPLQCIAIGMNDECLGNVKIDFKSRYKCKDFQPWCCGQQLHMFSVHIGIVSFTAEIQPSYFRRATYNSQDDQQHLTILSSPGIGGWLPVAIDPC